MANSVKKTRRQLIVDIIIIILIAAFVIFLIVILSGRKETVTTTTTEKDKNSTLVCKTSKDLESGIFDYLSPNSHSHEIKIMLLNNKINKISYAYTGTYATDGAARNAHAFLHADYNEYMGKFSQKASDFSPNFNDAGTEVMISLFGQVENINSYTGKLFFLDSSEYNKAKTFSSDMLKKLYENKGFSCDYQE